MHIEPDFSSKDQPEFLTGRNDIFKELLNSKMNGNVIGITCSKLGNGMHLTCVDELMHEDGEVQVILKPFDTTGYFFPVNKITLSEIVSVFPFKSTFCNPFMNKMPPEDKESS